MYLLDVVDFYCLNDNALSLDTIYVSHSNYLIAGDFYSRTPSKGYGSMVTRRKDEMKIN